MTATAKKKQKSACVQRHSHSHLRMHYARYKIHANYTQLMSANRIQTSLKYGWNDDDDDYDCGDDDDNDDAIVIPF